ncbi:MAG: DUF2779 domain-containing protein [Microgenomates group bacterium]|jgi:hypothetical protein
MNSITLSKTDYILYRACKKNAWYKIHEPKIYYQHELSAFERMIIQAGNEVELAARKLFPAGVLVEGRDRAEQLLTLKYIEDKTPIIFQAAFEKDYFFAAIDILELNSETNGYTVYEVKSTNEIDEKIHYYDLAFQVNLLRKSGLTVEKICLIHLNKEYIRSGELNIIGLFQIEDITEKIESLCEEVSIEMDSGITYLSQESLPVGFCTCVYKGRSNHCTCFSIINPDIPEYGIHDISRIGLSRQKLQDLVDGNIFEIHQIPPHIKLSDIQQNQIDAYKSNAPLINKDTILKELQNLKFPLYFIDYETLPCAIPRFDGFSPYQHIPFQYSLYVLESADEEPKLLEFLHSDLDDPSRYFVDSLQKNIQDSGSVIVWNKVFECGRNSEIALRIPEVKEFIDSLNIRVYDLMDIFKKQYYVHKDFKGSTSIKKVLPVMVPSLSYKELEIQDGGSAAEIWNRLYSEKIDQLEKEKIITDLKKYCGLDAYAMYAIWKELYAPVII